MTALRLHQASRRFPLLLPVLLYLAGCGSSALETISIEPSAVTMTVGQSVQFRVIGRDAKGRATALPGVSWGVDGSNGQIDASGLFTATQPGTAMILAVSSTVTGQASVTVERDQVAQLTTTVVPPTVAVGKSTVLTVTALDAAGSRLADVVLHAQAMTTETQIAPLSSPTDPQGQVTFMLTAARQPGPNIVEIRADQQHTTVTVPGMVGAPARVHVQPAATTVTAGDDVPLRIRVEDEAGNPVPGQQVHLTVLSEGATLTPTEVTTDAQGGANPVLHTSPTAGDNRLRLAVASLPAQDVEVHGRAGTPVRLSLQADRTTTVAGGSVVLTARVQDAHDNPVADVPVQFTATPADARLASPVLQTDPSGTVQGHLTTSPEPTSYTVEAVVAGLDPRQLTIIGQPPTVLQIAPAAATLVLGSAQRFQAMALDASGQSVAVQPDWKVVGDTGTIAPDGTFTSTRAGSDALLAMYAGLTAGAQVTVEPGEVAQLRVTPEALTVPSGTTQPIQVTALNAYGYPLEVTPTWGVSHDMGDMDGSGRFTATGAGSGEILVQAGSVTQRVPVTVLPGPLATIVTDPDHLIIEAGQAIQLFARGQDAAGNTVALTPTWRLLQDLGDITAAGLFQARWAGPGHIRVAADASPVAAEIPVEVRPAALFRIEIQPQTATVSAGIPQPFLVTGYDRFGNAMPVVPLWTLSTPLGTMDATGTLRAERVGALVVQATVAPFTVQASVRIVPGPLAGLALTPSEPLHLVAGMSVTIDVTGHDAYGNTVSVTPQWTQSPPLGVMEDRMFRAEKVGTMHLLAQSAGQQAMLPITITPGKLAGLALTPSNPTLQAGAALAFQATGLDAYANPLPVQPDWQVAGDIGTVDAAGRLTVRQAGSGQVMATVEGITASTQVTVEPGALALLKVTPAELHLTAGDSVDLAVVGFDAFGNPITAQAVWHVPEGLGSITPAGQLTAQKAGAGQIIVAIGNLAALVPLRVTPGEAAALQVEPATARVVSGQRQAFTVQGVDRGGNLVPVGAVQWHVEGGIGTIDATGVFTATLAETGRVVATVGGLTGTAEVRVEPGAVRQLRLAPESVILTAGETVSLYAEAFDGAGNRVPAQPTWDVTESLGALTDAHTFQARQVGVGRLTAWQETAQQSIDIQVQAGPLARLEVVPAQTILKAGNTFQFSAHGYDAHGNTVPVTPLWSLQGMIGHIDPYSGTLQASSAGMGTVVANVGALAALAQVQVEPASATRLQLTPGTTTVPIGQTAAFTVTAWDAYGNETTTEVAWSLTEPRGNLTPGFFQARQRGSTAVTARAGDLQAQALVLVTPGPAIRLQVAPEWREVRAGKTRQLRAFGYDAYDNIWEVPATWELRGAVGQLTPEGFFTASTQGSAQVVARFGSLVALADITVVPGPLHQLIVQPEHLSLAATTAAQFTATGVDRFGNQQAMTAHWAVTPGIGQMDPDGRLTAMHVGSGTVVALTPNLAGTAPVQVQPGPAVLLFVAPQHTTLRAGESVQFQIRGEDAYHNAIVPLPVRWSVSGDVGTIDPQSGMFTAQRLGWGKVQAALGNALGSAAVEVEAAGPDAEHSRLMSPQTAVLADGKAAAEIIVMVRDRFGNAVQNAQVRLMSSRADRIAQPGPSNRQGVAIGHVRSTSPGVSDITAVVDSIQLPAPLRVKFHQSGISG